MQRKPKCGQVRLAEAVVDKVNGVSHPRDGIAWGKDQHGDLHDLG